MDSYYDDTPFCTPPSEDMRVNLGYTNDYAQRMILSSTTPQGGLASTGYCLANPGVSYLVYAPGGGSFTLDLSAATQSLDVEWFNRANGTATSSGTVSGGGVQTFTPPFGGDAVLFVFDPDAAPPPPPPPGNTVGDLDGNGVVNLADLLILVNAWGTCPTPPDPCIADLSGNGTVGLEDLLILLNHWSSTNDSGGETSPAQPSPPSAKPPKTNGGKTKAPSSDDSDSKKPAGTRAPANEPSPSSGSEAVFNPVGWPFVPSAWNPKIVARDAEVKVQPVMPFHPQ
jgi:hypothetical protein